MSDTPTCRYRWSQGETRCARPEGHDGDHANEHHLREERLRAALRAAEAARDAALKEARSWEEEARVREVNRAAHDFALAAALKERDEEREAHARTRDAWLAEGVAERARGDRMAEALREALDGWEYAAKYKGDYLAKKHGDAEDIARLRALAAPSPDAAKERDEARFRPLGDNHHNADPLVPILRASTPSTGVGFMLTLEQRNALIRVGDAIEAMPWCDDPECHAKGGCHVHKLSAAKAADEYVARVLAAPSPDAKPEETKP